MPNTIQIKRRPAASAPGAPAALAAGELAVNFAGDQAGDPRPALYVGDGTAVIPLLRASDFAGGPTTIFATDAEVKAGTARDIAVDPGGLGSVFTPAVLTAGISTGATGVAGDANKVVVLDANGKVDPVLLPPATALVFATPAEVAAGVATDIAIDPAGLGSVFTPAVLTAGISTGATGVPADANKVVVLAATGKIDPVLLDLSAVAFATPAEVKAGVATRLPVDPAGLGSVFTPPVLTAGVSIGATGVAADANKVVVLDANGKIPNVLLNIGNPLTYLGAMDFATAAPAIGPIGGLWVHNGAANATIDPSWGVGTTANPGDLMISDGAAWNYIDRTVDLANYLQLSGGTMGVAAKIQWTGAIAAEVGNVLLDLKGGSIDNAALYAGTF